MRLLTIAVLLALAATAGSAADIVVSGNPPLPVANIIQNPGMEAGQGAMPDGWSFGTAIRDNFLTEWKNNGRSGKCLWMKAKTEVMSGYFHQNVPVQGQHSYLFKGFYRLAGGKMLIYAHASQALPNGRRASVDQRFFRGTMRGHWLVPVFLPPDSLGGPDPEAWLPFRLEAAIPDGMTDIALSLGLYFQAGEVSFDDIWAGLARTDLTVSAKAPAGDTLRRVVVRPAGVARPVFDSGELKAGTADFQTIVKQQPTDAVYEVIATLTSGKALQSRYPEEEVK